MIPRRLNLLEQLTAPSASAALVNHAVAVDARPVVHRADAIRPSLSDFSRGRPARIESTLPG